MEIVSLVWEIAKSYRPDQRFSSVLDLGAGDARFSEVDAFDAYVGVELDNSRIKNIPIRANVNIVHADAMAWKGSEHSLCIGNPPFVKHHRLNAAWREQVLQSIEQESGVRLKRTANLFALFMMQALLRTRSDGLVVQIVPYEWVTRPSTDELRAYIRKNGWNMTALRFDTDIFPTVLTTASITIIDKRSNAGQWSFGKIGPDGTCSITRQASGSHLRVLSYEKRQEALFAQRGLSPGGQDIFVLTEEQRLYYSLKKGRDVRPCVTSLRGAPGDLHRLGSDEFHNYFVAAGKPCWLIRSDREKLSSALHDYLADVGDRWQKYTTCTTRACWWQYKPHAVPQILLAAGFVGRAPKIAVNDVGAIAAGSVYGIFARRSANKVAQRLREFDFRRRVVHHANDLKKIEVKQLNSVLNELIQ